MNNSIIVVGGSGYLGKAIIKTLSSNSIEVTCADIVQPEGINVPFIKYDILNNKNVDLNKYNVIINCTGQITKPIESCLLQNSIGIINLLKNINPKTYLIQISTVGVYGTKPYALEEDNVNPETAYSTAKSISEKIIINTLNSNSYIILRLCNLYGENQTKGVLAYLKRSYQSDLLLDFNHNGNLLRSFLHVNDCAKTIYSLISDYSNTRGIFNLSTHDTYTIKELVKLVEQIKEIKYTTAWKNNLPWENIEEISIKKIINQISFKPEKNLITFIKETFTKE